ncbi:MULTISPECIES: hypothetical protein [Pseudoalteromonas]|uniref:hypothetical protein n=1 Tax=Pseudoalteromonas TaxID=53246 RepID=UPI000587884A|nr:MULTISPECIES: hypothetical protein [Pseudoalteromonas]TMS65587.1 hypothetical protein CWB83_12720 [Pseudoalteromonas sp. S1691]TMS66369.1 hypothetical protein CWB86_17855 [Pseudoalteromonas sp. S1731]TMS73917.1 hypothetical protein CWB88_08830 [Pseudoalteromonas sp. S1941]TMS77135.1 hypothetical protein CWB82_12575 [Pseudoalteromonas sp. S1690]TMS86073.1 hypothetical protein CWB70_06890 [Pseudoalteromonas sp. S981]
MNSEIQPFLPALSILENRLEGEHKSQEQLLSLLDELSILNEAQIISELLSLDYVYHQYKNDQSETWDITLESFTAFKNRSVSISRSQVGVNSVKIFSIFEWIMLLCNWEANVIHQTTAIN